MKCPYCGYQESKVVDSRHSDDGMSIRRRRECLSCQKRFTTYILAPVQSHNSYPPKHQKSLVLNMFLKQLQMRALMLKTTA